MRDYFKSTAHKLVDQTIDTTSQTLSTEIKKVTFMVKLSMGIFVLLGVSVVALAVFGIAKLAGWM
jgi:hypothetical protein